MPREPRRKDRDAAELIHKLMVNEGHSARSLSMAIKAKGTRAGYPPHRVSVSPDSLEMVFRTAHVPGPRIRFAIAFYFDLKPGQIWAADALDWAVFRIREGAVA